MTAPVDKEHSKDSDDSLTVMSFGDHLEELRSRILRALLVTIFGFSIALFFQEHLLEFMVNPHKLAMQRLQLAQSMAIIGQELLNVAEELAAVNPAEIAEDLKLHEEVLALRSELSEQDDRIELLGENLKRVLMAQKDAIILVSNLSAGNTLQSQWLSSRAALANAIPSIQQAYSWAGDELFNPIHLGIMEIDSAEKLRAERASAADYESASAVKYSRALKGLEHAVNSLARAKFEAGRVRLHVFSYPEHFFANLKLCFLAGVLLGLPWLAFEFWRFVAAGLYLGERQAVKPFLPISLLSMLAGASFAYLVMIPIGLAYLGGYGSASLVETSFRLKDYLSLVLTLIIGMAMVFQLPLVMVFLSRAGLVDPEIYRRYRKFSVLGALVLASILTPPDVVTQLLMAGPMVLLYEIGIWFSSRQTRSQTPVGEPHSSNNE